MRPFPINKSPLSNQEMSITLGGKTWVICSEGQLEWIKKQAKEQFQVEAYDNNLKEDKHTEYIENRLKEYENQCEYITLTKALSMMTPKERQAWENWYRFTPISVCKQS